VTDDDRRAWDAKLEAWTRELQTFDGRRTPWANEETRTVAATISSDDEIRRVVLVVGFWYATDFEDVPAPRDNYPPAFAQWLRELVEDKLGVDQSSGSVWDFTAREIVAAALDRVDWDKLAERWLAQAIAQEAEGTEDEEPTS
jgi:hypothetical protein